MSGRRFIRAVGGGDFPVGTAMLFYADTAPTGWTINTAVDKHMVDITDGSANGGDTGGTTAGNLASSTFFNKTGTQTHALTTAQMPAHTHTVSVSGGAFSGAVGTGNGVLSNGNTGSAGSGQGHFHNIDLRIWRARCIIATKD